MLSTPPHTAPKLALHYRFTVEGGDQVAVCLRLTSNKSLTPEIAQQPFQDFDALFEQRIQEADAFYRELQPATLNADQMQIQRQAYAGMIWSKQFYFFSVEKWLKGDPGQPVPPRGDQNGRNKDWEHLDSMDVLSMPDKWEYPWFAAWDLAFHCIPFARLDSDFAKEQLILLGREWFQHPNGQVPAYEWNFSDVNPPVLAWASWRVYTIERRLKGKGDLMFLERVFHKLLLNFTWWVNRKDAEGRQRIPGRLSWLGQYWRV